MFWMILGDDSYAKAQYWKWKPEANSANPRVWKVEHGAKDNVCTLFESLSVILTMILSLSLSHI